MTEEDQDIIDREGDELEKAVARIEAGELYEYLLMIGLL